MAHLFSRIRKDLVVAVLGTVGAVSALTGCSSNEATYRPAPAQTKAPANSYSQPTYTQPTQPTYTAPAAPRPAAPPQMACGKGKCG